MGRLSDTERIARGLLKHYLPNEQFLFNVRPEWLINPTTNYALELDIYDPKLKTAWEIQGIQHGRFTPSLQTTHGDFLKQLDHDMHKVNVCQQRGIALYRLTIFDLSQDSFEPFIKRFMKSRGLLSQFEHTTPPRMLYAQAKSLSHAKVKGANIQPYRKPGLWPLLQRMWWRHKQYRKGLSRRVYG